MTWTVMRRELDRNVRVAECATEVEARARLREAIQTYPNEEAWIEGDRPLPPRKGAEVPIVEHFDGPAPPSHGQIPQARLVSEQPRAAALVRW